MIKLDARLAAAAEMVRPGSVAADIGSDHGYLACHLVQRELCPKVYACDINVEPLERTKRTIRQCGLGDRVEARLSDGLAALHNAALDDVVIAGMGGELIAQILDDAPWLRDEHTRFILQPMSKAERLRAWLYQNGYELLAERAVSCGRFSYSVMQAAYCGEKREISLKFAWTGLLWDNESSEAIEYLQHVLSNIQKIAGGTGDTDYIALTKELRARLR